MKRPQFATYNGQPFNACWLANTDLVQGGALELNLGPKPNLHWVDNNEKKSVSP